MSRSGTAGLRSYLIAVAVALLSACASYQPVPLEEPGRPALASPAVDELRVAAASLQHPYLAPLVLDLDDGLSPDEAAVLAVLANPDLAALRAQRGLAEAQLLAAGILPNPQLVLGASVARNDPAGVTGSTLGVGFDLAALVTRGARRASARLSRDQVDLEVAWQEWQVAQAARLRLYRRFYLEAQERLAAQREATLAESYRLTEEAAERRLVTEIERAAAEAALHEARALRLEAAAQAEQARLDLLRILGFPPGATFDLQLLEDAEPPSATVADAGDGGLVGEASIAGLEARRLDLAALRLGYKSQEERVRATVLAQFPAINVSLTHTKDTAGLRTFDPAVAIDFPIFDRNQGEIAAERASREILRREYAARLFEARADVAELAAASASARQRIAQAAETVEARRRLLAIYGEALRFGDADVLTFHNAQIDLLASELDRLALRLSLAEIEVGLATVRGRGGPQ